MMPVGVSAKRWPISRPRVHCRLPIAIEPNAVGAMPPDALAPDWMAIVLATGVLGCGAAGARPYIGACPGIGYGCPGIGCPGIGCPGIGCPGIGCPGIG